MVDRTGVHSLQRNLLVENIIDMYAVSTGILSIFINLGLGGFRKYQILISASSNYQKWVNYIIIVG